MVRVSIDVGRLRTVVQTLKDFKSTAAVERGTVQGMAMGCGVGVPTLAANTALETQITDAADALSDRVDLAVLVNGGDPGFAGTVSYDIPADTADGTRVMIGTELAALFEDLPWENYPSEGEARHMAYLLQMMQSHQDDELVTGTMFNTLGPDGTLGVFAKYQNLSEAFMPSGQTPFEWREEGGWLEGSSWHEWVDRTQDDFLAAYSHSLGTATNGPTLDDDFGSALADTAIEFGGTSPWALSRILAAGTYGEDFLLDTGRTLYEHELTGDGAPIWSPMLPNGEVPEFGSDYEQKYFDPFVGLFESMARTPEAALHFFSEPADTSSSRVDYFVDQRMWDHDDMNALAQTLDAATTSFREPGTLDAHNAAWLASATVGELADRGAGIPDEAKDSFGHMLATYVADVDRVADNGDSDLTGGVFDYGDNPSAPWYVGLPPGADFDYESLRTVMQSVLTDDGAVEMMGDASREWNSHKLATSSDAVADLRDDIAEARADGDTTRVTELEGRLTAAQDKVADAVQGQYSLNGFVMGTIDAGTEGDAADKDARNQKFIDFASDVAGLIPTGGTFTSFLADQAMGLGQDHAEGRLTGNEARVSSGNLDVQQQSIEDSDVAAWTALAQAGMLPEGALAGETGPYPWYDDEGRLDLDVAMSDENRTRFFDSISDDAGERIQNILGAGNANYDAGFGRGGGDNEN